MADVPSSSPPKVVKGGLSSLKKLPPWAWILIIGGGLVVIMVMRKNAQSKATSTDASSTDTSAADPNAGATTDPSYYTDPNAGLGYGYQDPGSGLGGFLQPSGGGSGGVEVMPSPAGPTTPTDTNPGGTTTGTGNGGGGGISNTFSPTVVNSPVITGGGAPAKPSGVHTAPTASRPPKPPDPKAGGHYVWNNGKWNLIHWDNKKKKWVPGPVR